MGLCSIFVNGHGVTDVMNKASVWPNAKGRIEHSRDSRMQSKRSSISIDFLGESSRECVRREFRRFVEQSKKCPGLPPGLFIEIPYPEATKLCQEQDNQELGFIRCNDSDSNWLIEIMENRSDDDSIDSKDYIEISLS